jgi:GAF domain-containing protein
MKPLARKSGIFAENLPEEVVLYDKTHDKVHCLNKTAAAVWENSDGSKTVDELTQVVEAKSGVPADRELVLQAVEELDEAGLMEVGSAVVAATGLPSRREAVGKMVMAGSALVATIVAAAPKAHASQDPPKHGDPPPVPTPHNPPPPDPPSGGNWPPKGGHKNH